MVSWLKPPYKHLDIPPASDRHLRHRQASMGSGKLNALACGLLSATLLALLDAASVLHDLPMSPGPTWTTNPMGYG